MEKLYESIVTSRTYDIEENIMYPEKVSKKRTYEEIRRLISQGHTMEIRDGVSNVEISSLELLDELYKPAKDETPVVDEDNSISITDPTASIILPDGRVVNISEIMSSIVQNEDTGQPQYLPKTEELPQINIPPIVTTPPAPELTENASVTEKSEEETKVEEKAEEEAKEVTAEGKNKKKSKKEEENK